MDSGLPEDLESLRDWGNQAIEAAWNLWNAESHSTINDARSKLTKLLCDPPSISQTVCRELTVASDEYRGRRRVSRPRFGGVPAKHPLDAIKELSWQILERAHFQSRCHIQLQIALTTEAVRLGGMQPKNRELWVSAIRALEQVERNRNKLPILLPRFKAIIRKFPCAARPIALPNMPPPTVVLRPGGDLATLLMIMLHRVWEQRLAKRATAPASPTTPDDANDPARKTQRQRRAKRSDEQQDEKLYRKWKGRDGQFRTYAEFAGELGIPEAALRQAVDRHRKRIQCRN